MSRAFVFTEYGGPEHQKLVDRPVPEAASGELAVRVHAAGVNPYDWKFRSGRMGTKGHLPHGMGTEVAGIVTAVGDGVEGFAVGDAVLGSVARGQGAFAEDTVVRADQSVKKPAEISFAVAATIPVAGTTAYDLTHQHELKSGDTMLILGAGGGVGLIATQVGRIRKFNVIGVASESKREIVESTGVAFVPSGEGAAERVREIAPDGVDLIVDLVGGDALRAIASTLTENGSVASAVSGDIAEELGGSGRVREPDTLSKITDLFKDGLVVANIRASYPLDDAAKAVARVEEGHSAGKTIIEVIPA